MRSSPSWSVGTGGLGGACAPGPVPTVSGAADAGAATAGVPAPTVTVATTARVARVANQGRRREELGMRPTSLADAATGVAPPG